jgi:hypothetical protein
MWAQLCYLNHTVLYFTHFIRKTVLLSKEEAAEILNKSKMSKDVSS